MNYYELECYSKQRVHELDQEIEEINRFKSVGKRMHLIKSIVLTVGEALIRAGIGLQNLFQPTIQSTFEQYRSELKRAA